MIKTIVVLTGDSNLIDMVEDELREIDRSIYVKVTMSDTEAYRFAQKERVTLFVIDNELKNENDEKNLGLRTAQRIRQMKRHCYTPMILIGASGEVAYKSYNAIHDCAYMNKPVSQEQIHDCLYQELLRPGCEIKHKFVLIRQEGILYRRDLLKLLWLENSKKGMTLHFADGILKIPYRPYSEFMRELGYDRMIQCSRHCYVNKDYIERVDLGEGAVKLLGEEEKITIGEAFVQRFLTDVCDSVAFAKD